MLEQGIELNEHGLMIWKHKHHPTLQMTKEYSWIDQMRMTDNGQVIDIFQASTHDWKSSWVPMTKEEYNQLVKNCFTRAEMFDCFIAGDTEGIRTGNEQDSIDFNEYLSEMLNRNPPQN